MTGRKNYIMLPPRSGRLWTRCVLCVAVSCDTIPSVSQKFTNPLPSYEPLFQSPEAKAALERTIAIHFLRTGQFNTAETFINVR